MSRMDPGESNSSRASSGHNLVEEDQPNRPQRRRRRAQDENQDPDRQQVRIFF